LFKKASVIVFIPFLILFLVFLEFKYQPIQVKDSKQEREKKVISLYKELYKVGLEEVIDRRYGKDKKIQLMPHSNLDFNEITTQAGIDFIQTSGYSNQYYYAEVVGQGALFFDADNDSDVDLYLLNGNSITKPDPDKAQTNRLYLNDGTGNFEKSIQISPLNDSRYSMGVCGGDYDNDGDMDLYVTNFDDDNALFTNNGSLSFTDTAKTAGVTGKGETDASCAFADIDNDGWLDLYVTYYVDHSKTNNPNCRQKSRDHCGPHRFNGPTDILYKNNGDGTFSNITERLGKHSDCRSLGVAFSDLDLDLDQDLIVVCDRNPNLYFENINGYFKELGLMSGMAVSYDGIAQAGMGVVAGDYDNDGLIDLAATYFVAEANGLYKNIGNNRFIQNQHSSGTTHETAKHISWGTEFFDADLNGYLDWIIVNGHAQYQIENKSVSHHGSLYKEQNNLMLNLDGKNFEDASNSSGSAFLKKNQSRGLALADIDNDGDLDILITNLNDSPTLIRNDTPLLNKNWLKVKLIGTKSNRDGIGSRVVASFKNGSQTREIKSGQSYLSQSELIAHFGLGANEIIPELNVYWPSGEISTLQNIKSNQTITIKE
jgi:hypothetical protein